MNMPIKADEQWLKSLKKGDKLYTTNYSSAEDAVTVMTFVFEEYTKDNKSEDKTEITAMVKADIKNSVPMKTNIDHGFFETPLKAIEAFQEVMTKIVDACEKAKVDYFESIR